MAAEGVRRACGRLDARHPDPKSQIGEHIPKKMDTHSQVVVFSTAATDRPLYYGVIHEEENVTSLDQGAPDHEGTEYRVSLEGRDVEL